VYCVEGHFSKLFTPMRRYLCVSPLLNLTLYRVTSRKVIMSSVSLMSCVNLMVSCGLFISVMIFSENCLWDPVQMIKMSSMNRFQIWMSFVDVYNKIYCLLNLIIYIIYSIDVLESCPEGFLSI
jgi:hypothetical protein